MGFQTSDYIALLSVAVAAFSAIASAVVTWLVMRRNFGNKKLAFNYSMEPILSNVENAHILKDDLTVTFRGTTLSDPTILDITVSNVGLSAVEDTVVVIRVQSPTYLLPGYYMDVPAGYEPLWSMDQPDSQQCILKYKHINRKQTATARILMNRMPQEPISISCPMANVEFVQSAQIEIGPATEIALSILYPRALSIIRFLKS